MALDEAATEIGGPRKADGPPEMWGPHLGGEGLTRTNDQPPEQRGFSSRRPQTGATPPLPWMPPPPATLHIRGSPVCMTPEPVPYASLPMEVLLAGEAGLQRARCSCQEFSPICHFPIPEPQFTPGRGLNWTLSMTSNHPPFTASLSLG